MGVFKNFKGLVASEIMGAFRIGGKIAPKDKAFAETVIHELDQIQTFDGVWNLVVEEYKVLDGSDLYGMLAESIEEEGVA
jgi:hypothetical protein